MPKSSPISLGSLIISLRDLARNPAIRRKALQQRKPLIVEQGREQSFFVLLPPALYNKLYELFRDLRDSHDLAAAVQEGAEWHNWEDVKKELHS